MVSYRIIGVLGLMSILLFACENSGKNAVEYFDFVNQAELKITQNNFDSAAEYYEEAFDKIDKPFGKDLYNAAIINSIIGDQKSLHDYLQILINNTEELSFIESTLVGPYISQKEWDRVLGQREIRYDKLLRSEMKRINERDQLFRPHYDTHMDTIEKIRKENLNRIFDFTRNKEFPGHQEMGYSRNLKEQPHHIVLYHTTQRRSQDKKVDRIDDLLREAVYGGKLDPEQAISYLRYQNDMGAGPYEIYTVFQVQHPLLPDSLQNKSWEKTYDQSIRKKADSVRNTWLANSMQEMSVKAKYLKSAEHPFIFSGIHREIYQLPLEMSKKEVMERYERQTSRGMEY